MGCVTERPPERLRHARRARRIREIAVQAHFLLGARHFLEQMIESDDGPGDEAVVDAYLALVRDGLRLRPGSRARSAGSRAR
ncbi:MAG: hypothetical protein JRH19_11995 [Deltaproteobacteria bacterium]|nr:hypothetical protein [Deltaproteobacteria bacterium]